MRIPNRARADFAYGIGFNYNEHGDFSFLIGEEVSEVDHLEDGFISLVIPSGKYAVFKVNSAPELGQNTWKYIYGTWLPNAGYERREGPDFEVTDVCRSQPGQIEMKIYIPII